MTLRRALAALASLLLVGLVAPAPSAQAAQLPDATRLVRDVAMVDGGHLRVFTTATTCQSFDYPRPTSSGWYRDPCAYTTVYRTRADGSNLYRMAAAVDFGWSSAGGMHITGAQGTARVTDMTQGGVNAYNEVEVSAINLGYTQFATGVIATCTDCPLNYHDGYDTQGWTTRRSGVGCGDYNSRYGGSSLWTHGYFRLQAIFGGGITSDDLYSAPSYYQFAADGVC